MLFSKKIDLTKLVTLQSGDILILIDSTWLNNNYKQLDDLKKKNVKIVAVIYDIIPVINSEFCTIDLTHSLKEWYQKATKYIDGYIAISNTVKNEIYTYIKSNLLPDIQKQKFDYFYLGANLSTKYEENDVSEIFKSYFKNQNTYITVSTIEPRKNHSFILDAFDVLWSNNEDLTYIIIGRIGWNTEGLIKRIKSHKEYGKKLFLLDNVEDNELIYAIKCESSCFASCRGFGLPIIESLLQTSCNCFRYSYS
jgi:alpha-1,2-rhamnosyltransferase